MFGAKSKVDNLGRRTKSYGKKVMDKITSCENALLPQKQKKIFVKKSVGKTVFADTLSTKTPLLFSFHDYCNIKKNSPQNFHLL